MVGKDHSPVSPTAMLVEQALSRGVVGQGKGAGVVWPVVFDALVVKVSVLEAENADLRAENARLRAECGAAEDAVLELLHDLENELETEHVTEHAAEFDDRPADGGAA